MRIAGQIVGTDTPSLIEVQDGRISTITPVAAPPEADLGAPDVMVAPALLDMQVNGNGGLDFSGGDDPPEEIAAAVIRLNGAGLGLFCPTLITNSTEGMLSGLRALSRAWELPEVARSAVVMHMEGPYISPHDGPRGAHNRAVVRPPDWDEFCRFQEAAGGRIGYVTLAPELPGALDFIGRLAADGIIAAIGHTAADPQTIRDAVAAGARFSTHLGNGSADMLKRHPNFLWEQLAADELWAGIIADGFHLPPAVVKCFVRAKGIERTILVSDSGAEAGLEPGVYSTDGGDIELLPNGKIVLCGTPYLAGTAIQLHQCVANAVRFTGLGLADIVPLATLNPARALGIDDRVGSVEVGKDATLTLFRWDEDAPAIEIVATVVRGQIAYRA